MSAEEWSPDEAFWDRFFAKVTVADFTACWVWNGAKVVGYGSVGTPGRRTAYAHRLIYTAAVGPIPDRWQVDHLCRNRACVNPLHLEAVTQRENLRRQAAARLLEVTACPKGHPYTQRRTQRACNPCTNARRDVRKHAARAHYLCAMVAGYEAEQHPHRNGSPCLEPVHTSMRAAVAV